MNLYTRQSLPNLWLYSFSVTNRALPRLLAIVLGTFLLLSAMGFVVFRFLFRICTDCNTVLFKFCGVQLNCIICKWIDR